MTGVETMLLGAAAAGSGAAATAATTGLIGAGGAFSLGTALSTGLTLASASSALFGGFGQADAFKAQASQEAYALNMSAREETLAAKEETLRGKRETNNIMDNLVQTIASQKLAYAANGVDIGFGTPVSVNESTRRLTDLQMGVTRDDARIRSMARRRGATATREQALNTITAGKQKSSAAMTGGFSSAGSSIANLIDRRISRG